MDAETKAGKGVLRPRAAVVFALVLTLLLASLSGLVMLPAAQHLRSLQDGRQAEATLVAAGSGCFLGGCKVRFEAEGRTVVANLPVGSGHGENVAGERLTVRYREDDPQVVASQNDVGGGGPAAATVVFGAGAVLFLVMAVWASVHVRRQRRTEAG
ncbi:DUF3592 domain-containing protein [Streptomyces sp. NBC_00233]|uniref:DUF3592 domain-containing protein n=1 Tax=Streptomyces sp. NBC_00233 TaxID=2975686 RepID=UPI002255D061|nr:DUF3592 domain-containing protein [Streptomyces sp. NBC_00233]MCX5229384.1 hypothetical protein [Streptomyces sp. NBC_00233]